MLGIFAKLGNQLKIKVFKVRVDNFMFKMHYRFTFVALMVSCLLVSCRQFIGEHINCIQDSGAVPQNVLNTYCFIATTFTLPKNLASRIGDEVAAMGVGPHKDSDEKKYHAYYQWVPFVLFLQGLMFYAPWWIWKQLENGKIRTIITGLNTFTVDCKERQCKERILVNYIMDTLHEHNWYAIKFFLCEVLCAVNVVGNIYFTDYFLGGEFLQYGPRVVKFLEMDPEERFDPMAHVFPRITKCTFHKYGSSGTVQRHDSLCVLALNIMNEKIYVFLWFWLVILSILTGLHLMYRMATLTVYPLRAAILKSVIGAAHADDLDIVMQKCQVGDWLLLYFLGRNMDMMVFNEFVRELAKSLAYGTANRRKHLEDSDDPRLCEGRPMLS